MSKEIGPRERALREQREAQFEENQKRMREQSKAEKLGGLKPHAALAGLLERVAEAAKKTGRSRKRK